jgi:hypothetical protein
MGHPSPLVATGAGNRTATTAEDNHDQQQCKETLENGHKMRCDAALILEESLTT